MPFGLSSWSWIPEEDLTRGCSEEGTRRAVVEVARMEGEGASQDAWRGGTCKLSPDACVRNTSVKHGEREVEGVRTWTR